MTEEVKEETITISRNDLPDADSDLDLNEADFDLAKAKVIMDGNLAEVVRQIKKFDHRESAPRSGRRPLHHCRNHARRQVGGRA